MAALDNQYTSIDFLSKIRLPPAKRLFKQLSLNEDLEEICRVLSPRHKKEEMTQMATQKIDIVLTKKFFVEIMSQYESEQKILEQWNNFTDHLKNPSQFDFFLERVKNQSKEVKKIQSLNPEQKKIKNKKSFSTKKWNKNQSQVQIKKTKDLKDKIRAQIKQMRSIIQKGQKFIYQK